ncbi:hypothetical protein BBJ28_00008217 [Nothophytophthora sp. Chile5]|nr:hypothetical protein BBJ28_00008217 [Nothophytophthora sp. Chile5]
MQRKVYIEHLGISDLQVTITARVAIPVLNSFDGTPLHFGATRMREVFSFPDQLYKDLAADYVADTIVRSPMLLMSLNILGNPAVVGAAAGVITTPIAIYKERQLQGLDTGIRNVMGGVGMGLVGIVARPMGGVASLVSMASDGLLYGSGMGGNRVPFDESTSRFDARPNELLRYKLKVLPNTTGSDLIFAHGLWVSPGGSGLLVSGHEMHYLSSEQLQAQESEPVRSLLLQADLASQLTPVTVVCSNQCLYVVGVSGAQNQTVLAQTSLQSVQTVEESLKEPTVFDIGVKTPTSAEWLRFRLPSRQRQFNSQARPQMGGKTSTTKMKEEATDAQSASPSPADGDSVRGPPWGDNGFRLLSLVSETQCEMEVVKPVLDELEVLRLCRGFGMMSSVNPKDFSFDVLHAREFDDDFARFLRYDLFDNSSLGGVRFKGLFGKQSGVGDALVEMKACSREMVERLNSNDEGIYCVRLEADCSGDQAPCLEVTKNAGVVVFSWIRDERFEAHHLRDTPAYVLRFLTCLTPDIVCCTSASDLEQIKTAATASDELEDNEFSSYSVSFHVEKQEDERDSVECVSMESVDLPPLSEDFSGVSLLKGSYPAVVLARKMPPTVRRESFRRSFPTHAQSSFPQWLKGQSEEVRIDLSPTLARLPRVCENVLKEFGMWPEEQVKACRDAHKEKIQKDDSEAAQRFLEEIERQRATVEELSDTLFRFRMSQIDETVNEPEFTRAAKAYDAFRGWLTSVCSWKLDRKFNLVLDAPDRLRELELTLYHVYSHGQESSLDKLVEMCATATHQELMRVIHKQREPKKAKTRASGSESRLIGEEERRATWRALEERAAESLADLRVKWWIAIESGLAVARNAGLKDLKEEEKKRAKSAVEESERLIVEEAFERLRTMLQSKRGLQLTLNARTLRKGVVCCEGTLERLMPPSEFQDLFKVATIGIEQSEAAARLEVLGRLLLDPKEKQVAMFTVKVRSVVQICTGEHRMCAKLIHFPPMSDASRPPHVSEKVIKTFGRCASLCDFDARDRILTFLAEDSVGIYKFDESFKRLELMKEVDLGVRSTLTALPFTDVLLLDSSVYVTDSSGESQSIDIYNDRTSNSVGVCTDPDRSGDCSRLLGLADNLVVGVVAVETGDAGAFTGELNCISRDDHRHLPGLSLDVTLLSDRVSVQCVGERVFVLDPLAGKLHAFSIHVTVRSDSYRMRQSDDRGARSSASEARKDVCLRKQHWLYAFYHVFEKFPVQGLLEAGPASSVAVGITCPAGGDVNAVLVDCHDYLSMLMSDLLALNKPLHGLDLTKKLAVLPTLDGVSLELTPLRSFLQALVTFVPVQICRAEGNALTVLRDGKDQSLDALEEEKEAWEAMDIAESIRFGLLSPVLCAWRGRCVVVTSMGKQSTGKSYFLNHLTGSSFAIAGNRCTDGAWMTVRVVKDVLLVVLDFEGLGSFERTDQEDVFLSVLNASLSMFTIFRMEMRFDKDIDGLFTKFQKGINLLKNDERLFCGTLYMSVKDVNPNDRHGVLSEFQRKFQKLLTANRERNFVTDMYSGQLKINCSPPLGTLGYYESLRHARQLIEKIVDSDPARGFRSGNSFHDCIRLVLAKISILDWTAVDESSHRLEMNDLNRKLPGVLRTGCLIPVDAQTREEIVPRYLMESLLDGEFDSLTLSLDQLSHDYPEFADCWVRVDQLVSLDGIDDEDVDFGPACCIQASGSTDSIHQTLLTLFQRFLALSSKGALEKITPLDYEAFDAILAFLVRRRKVKVALWVKQLRGPERFLDEWPLIEQTHLCRFEMLFKRCQHVCSECQLQCIRSACHSFDEEHDCGMSHSCRSLCEYCIRCGQAGKEIPPCAAKAGHEGSCDCGKGDHTCGSLCYLASASNCGQLCVLVVGHSGEHKCSVKQHMCGVGCSATNCGGKCILSTENGHTVHKCAETQCNHGCEMEGCKERCGTANHFHDQSNVVAIFAEENGQPLGEGTAMDNGAGAVSHMCNTRHACTATCEAEGICNKSVQVSSSKFSGSRDTFDFQLKQMVGVRNKCAVMLESGQKTHEGVAHSCATTHSCDARCVACEYYCDKVFGHEGDHAAAHGNMRNTYFVSQDEVINWQARTYAPGEKGIAEMCHMYCSSAGRGHAHYLKCERGSAAVCVYRYSGGSGTQRRHCTGLIEPRPKEELDELLHEAYWKTIGWEDPCRSAAERALFAKCSYSCNAPEHKHPGKSASCCDLEAWHSPTRSVGRDSFSYINGHRFTCSHTVSTGKLHHLFVLDCSGSMRGKPWYLLVEGVRAYLRNRIDTDSREDVVSVVTFGNKGTIEFERARIQSAAGRFLPFRGGGTFYANGLQPANAILSRADLSVFKPVLIFFTDGRPADRKKGLKLAADMRERFAPFGLRSFVVGYGRVSDLGVAEIAEELGGTVHESIPGADLCATFYSISQSLGARAGLIAMLWVDKYRPTALEELDFHPEVTKRLGNLASAPDLPHLLVYGPSGAGKKTRVMALLRALYGDGALKLRLEHKSFKVPNRSTKVEVTTVASNFHIELNPSDAGSSDRLVVQQLLKEIAQYHLADANARRPFKTVVLTEVDRLSRGAQHALRRTMEQHTATCRLVLLCDSPSKVIDPLRSRCLGVRVAAPSTDEICAVLQGVCSKEGLDYCAPLGREIAAKSERNLRRALLMLETCRQIQLPAWEDYVCTLAKVVLQEQSPAGLLKAREMIYELLSNCVPSEVILKVLCRELMARLDDDLKHELVHWAAYYEHRMQRGSKDIFHFEAFLAKFMTLYKKFLLDLYIWKQWKLEGAQIERLTATAAGPGADGALRALEATVANLRFFARGKRGVLFAGEMRATDLPVVAKFAADATSAGSVTLEARWLRVMNRMGIGAQLLGAGPGWFLCERLDGRNVVEFLSASDDTATREVSVLTCAIGLGRLVDVQCFAMDLMRVNKEEMTHPHRHILIHRSSQSSERWRCTFVDFEKCSTTKKPKNVTQLCQVEPRENSERNRRGLGMTTRKSRYWRAFLYELLATEGGQTPHDGACVFTLAGREEYREGCFQPLAIDPAPILALFDQLTRQAVLEERGAHRQKSECTDGIVSWPPALRIGASVFHVVSASFTSVCAVAPGGTRGLIAEKLPFGVLLVRFSAPRTLEEVYTHVDGRKQPAAMYFCAACDVYVRDSSASEHDQTTAHLLSVSKAPSVRRVWLPETNRGFQMLQSMGWRQDTGLGPAGDGRVTPVATTLKTDRAGIGAQATAKQTRVTHFPAHDEQQALAAPDGRSDAQRMQERLARKRKQQSQQQTQTQTQRKTQRQQEQQRDRAIGHELYAEGLEGYEQFLR